jgi:hypothetical protein
VRSLGRKQELAFKENQGLFRFITVTTDSLAILYWVALFLVKEQTNDFSEKDFCGHGKVPVA